VKLVVRLSVVAGDGFQFLDLLLDAFEFVLGFTSR
jgi:hypothetical protein